jgi:hypothetical protein
MPWSLSPLPRAAGFRAIEALAASFANDHDQARREEKETEAGLVAN